MTFLDDNAVSSEACILCISNSLPYHANYFLLTSYNFCKLIEIIGRE
jgi:hypothetical protein